MGEFDFSFKIEVDSWQRQLRRKHFLLLKRFRDRMKRFTDLTESLVDQTLPMGATGKLKSALKVLRIQEDMTQGIFLFSIYIDEKIAPHAKYVNTGRSPGKAPYLKIRLWVEKKLGVTGREGAYVAGKVMWKLLRVGFNNNHAPYHFMKRAEQYLSASHIKKLLYEIDLDIKEVMAGNGI